MRGDRTSGSFAQSRSEALACNGIVATSQPLAAQAGLKIREQGGDAFDAAVAGTMTVAKTLEPAAVLAEEGFGITERIRHAWLDGAQFTAADPDSNVTFLKDGKLPQLYDVVRNLVLALALGLAGADRTVFLPGWFRFDGIIGGSVAFLILQTLNILWSIVPARHRAPRLRPGER